MTAFEKAQEILQEYNEKRAELEIRYKKKLRDIIVPYAEEKARFKVGDIIQKEGHINIKIKSIGARLADKEIIPVYSGAILTKALKERKGLSPTMILESEDIIKLK